jgi:hypothetical protein
MNDINNPLENIKVQAALQSEYMKLEYRKKNRPDQINILDYTVIAALEQQLNGGWIPVEIKLPEKYDTYMVAWRPTGETPEDVKRKTNSDLTHYYGMLEYDPDDEAGWIKSIEQCNDYIILAWQPLPESYRRTIHETINTSKPMQR